MSSQADFDLDFDLTPLPPPEPAPMTLPPTRARTSWRDLGPRSAVKCAKRILTALGTSAGRRTGERAIRELAAADWKAIAHQARPHIVAIAALGTLTFGWFVTHELLWGIAL